MIPQRRLTRTGFGNGVSCRVEACRRRLRTVRTSEAQNRVEEDFAKLRLKPSGLKVERAEMGFHNFETQGSNEAEIT